MVSVARCKHPRKFDQCRTSNADLPTARGQARGSGGVERDVLGSACGVKMEAGLGLAIIHVAPRSGSRWFQA